MGEYHLKKTKRNIVIAFVCFFLIANVSAQLPFTHAEAGSQGMPLSDESFGIIIPLRRGDGLPYTSIQQSIANMVNDLLRMSIPVWWASTDFSAMTRTLMNETTENRVFERGAFIVPFTTNATMNAEIISIATDYGVGSEIESYYPVTMYFITEPISVAVYPLQYARCALRTGQIFGYGGSYFYSHLLYQSGFLDIQVLSEDEITHMLNNTAFNLLVWPGGVPTSLTDVLKTANVRICAAIRRFVNQGGGYVSSCNGAASASSGVIIPMYLMQNTYRNLPTIGLLALTSCSIMLMECAAYLTIEIVDHRNPVSFGLDTVQGSLHLGGPVFLGANISRNTQVVGRLKSVDVLWWSKKNIETMTPDEINAYLARRIGKPIWITSSFGAGKAVMFGCHPEYGYPSPQDRLVDNALFYATSGANTTIPMNMPMPFSDILALTASTQDITIPPCDPLFTDLWSAAQSVNLTCAAIDAALQNVSQQVFQIEVERGNAAEFPTRLHDSYAQWVGCFSKALSRLEPVYNLSKDTADISQRVSDWKNGTAERFAVLAKECANLSVLTLVVEQSLNSYDGSPASHAHILGLLESVEVQYKHTHDVLDNLWASTVKTYRELWYTYESRQPASVVRVSSTGGFGVGTTVSSTKGATGSDSTIYVDCQAAIGGDGSQDHPYQRIQEAVDAAKDGDTIYVHAGWYYEHPIIGKSVRLIGEDRDTTVIDGQHRPYHHVITTAPYVEIDNFTIQNSTATEPGLVLYSSHNIIQGNLFKDNGFGLGFDPIASNNTIRGNVFTRNTLMGVGIDFGALRDNIIEDNLFVNNSVGLYSVNAYNVIQDNMFVHDGVLLAAFSDPLVVELRNNTVNGEPLLRYKDRANFTITSAGEIVLSNCTNGLIDQVNLSSIDTGIDIRRSSHITIKDCRVQSSLVGIALQSSTDVTVTDSEVTGNRWLGMWLYHSSNNTLHDNIVSQNHGGMALLFSTSNTVSENNVTGNSKGISCWSQSSTNSFSGNNFIGNQDSAYDSGINHWDGNYWDDWVGLQSMVLRILPYHIPGRMVMNFDTHPADTPFIIL